MADAHPPIEVLRAARRWAEEHGHPQPDDRMLAIVYAAGLADALAEAGRLLPPDPETRIEWGTRLTWDDGAIEDVHCESREVAQQRVDCHAHRREETPGWRATAELITRPHWIGPWQQVPTGPDAKSE